MKYVFRLPWLKRVLGKQDGFSVVETITAVFVFSLMILAIGGIYVHILSMQRRGTGAQKVQEDMLYALEVMAREIRVSSITNQDDTTCAATTLTIQHPVNGTVTYTRSATNRIERIQGGTVTYLTSANVNVGRLRFCIDGTQSTGDNEQSRITVTAQIASVADARDAVTFDIQTTIVSRDNTLEFTN